MAFFWYLQHACGCYSMLFLLDCTCTCQIMLYHRWFIVMQECETTALPYSNFIPQYLYQNMLENLYSFRGYRMAGRALLAGYHRLVEIVYMHLLSVLSSHILIYGSGYYMSFRHNADNKIISMFSKFSLAIKDFEFVFGNHMTFFQNGWQHLMK